MTAPSAADAALQRLAAQAQAAAVAAAAHQQHMHNLQLDWLARTGVYMPRLIDYNGTKTILPFTSLFNEEILEIDFRNRLSARK
jgi:hypothetical protein